LGRKKLAGKEEAVGRKKKATTRQLADDGDDTCGRSIIGVGEE
jgi:hypothetical protein